MASGCGESSPVDPARQEQAGSFRLDQMLRRRDDPSTTPPVLAALGIRPEIVERGRMSYVMEPATTDLLEAGSISLPALAPMADAVLGGPFYTTLPDDKICVMSRLQISAVGDLDVDKTSISALGETIDATASSGLCQASMRTAGGDLICVGTGRSAIVDPFPGEAEVSLQPVPTPDRPRPLAEVLGLEPREDGDEVDTYAFPVRSYWTNLTGAVYGGVLAMVAGMAMETSLTQASGRPAPLSEFATTFLRGAPADGEPLEVRVRIVRAGRRVGVAESDVVDADGRLLVRSDSLAIS